MAVERVAELKKELLRLRQECMQINDEVDRAESWLTTLKTTQETLAMRYDAVDHEITRMLHGVAGEERYR